MYKTQRYCLDLGRKEKDDSFFSLANDTILGNYTKQIIHNGRKPVTSSFVPWGGTIIIANYFSLLSATNPSLPPCLRLLPKLRLQERLQIKPVVRGIRNHCKKKRSYQLAFASLLGSRKTPVPHKVSYPGTYLHYLVSGSVGVPSSSSILP